MLGPGITSAVDHGVAVFLDAMMAVWPDGVWNVPQKGHLEGATSGVPSRVSLGVFLSLAEPSVPALMSSSWPSPSCGNWAPSNVGHHHCQRVLLHPSADFSLLPWWWKWGGESCKRLLNLNLQGGFCGLKSLAQLIGLLLPSLGQAIKLLLCLGYFLPYAPELVIQFLDMAWGPHPCLGRSRTNGRHGL